MTHICNGSLTIIGSYNGLSPGRRQAIIWTSAGILLIGPLGTNFSDILIEIRTVSFKKIRLKVSSAKWRPFCFGLNVLRMLLFLMFLWLSVISWNLLLTRRLHSTLLTISYCNVRLKYHVSEGIMHTSYENQTCINLQNSTDRNTRE